MDQPCILTIHVTLDPRDSSVLSSPAGEVVLLPFGGTAEGEIFRGVVRPGAVDCQRVNAVGVRHMCARYLLEGTDREGQPCKIFVENNGWFTGQPGTDGFDTVPTFLTDSTALAPYLHRNTFRGRGEPRPDGVDIRFYEV